MKPTLEQYQMRNCNSSWFDTHLGIQYEITHHSISEYNEQGIWCYYVHLIKENFQNIEDFNSLDLPILYHENKTDNFKYFYDYFSMDLDFHGGITHYSKKHRFIGKTGEYDYSLKIGCDYNHLWDQESNFYEGYHHIVSDAKRTIDDIASKYPLNIRCGYTGEWDAPENFYKAKNGTMVLKTAIDKLPKEWDSWFPEEGEIDNVN